MNLNVNTLTPQQVSDWRALATSERYHKVYKQFTAESLMVLRDSIVRHNIPVENLLVCRSVYAEWLTQHWFISAFEPVTRHKVMIETGLMGNLYGMAVYSDAYVEDRLSPIAEGEVFLFSMDAPYRALMVAYAKLVD